MDEQAVVDALVESDAVRLSIKRRLALVNRAFHKAVRQLCTSGAAICVHPRDCTHGNVRFVSRAQQAEGEPHTDVWPTLKFADAPLDPPFSALQLYSQLKIDLTTISSPTAAWFAGQIAANLVPHCKVWTQADDDMFHPPGDTSDDPPSVKTVARRFLEFRGATTVAGYPTEVDHSFLQGPLREKLRAEWNGETVIGASYVRKGSDHLLTDWAIKRLAPVLHASPPFSVLYLERNMFGEAGVQCLFPYGWHREAAQLIELRLSHTPLGDAGVIALAHAMRRGPAKWGLVKLALENVGMDDEAADQLGISIGTLPALIQLNIAFNTSLTKLPMPDSVRPWVALRRVDARGLAQVTKPSWGKFANAICDLRMPALRTVQVGEVAGVQAQHLLNLAVQVAIAHRLFNRNNAEFHAAMDQDE